MFYQHMNPIEKQLQGIIFVGMTSSLPSLSEMQSLWLAEFWPLNSNSLLYSRKELRDFKARFKFERNLLEFQLPKLAAELDCHPPVEELLESDKELATALLNAHSYLSSRTCGGKYCMI